MIFFEFFFLTTHVFLLGKTQPLNVYKVFYYVFPKIYYVLNKPWQLFVMFRSVNESQNLSSCVKWTWGAENILGSGLKNRVSRRDGKHTIYFKALLIMQIKLKLSNQDISQAEQI